MLENERKEHNYEYKFPLISNKDMNILITESFVILNRENEDQVYYLFGYDYKITEGKTHAKAYFDRNYCFYFFAYNNASDFVSGYSTSYINFENKNEYHNSISNINLVKNDISPFNFLDEVEIKEMNFIRETEYVYYKLHNKNNGKTYYGLLDIKLNKILYNIEEEITTFIPLSSSNNENNVMLAITKTSA